MAGGAHRWPGGGLGGPGGDGGPGGHGGAAGPGGPVFRHGWGAPFAGFTPPCVLLLLRGGPLHGYALRDALESAGLIPDVDFGNLYRALRRMEGWGLVTSRWEVEGEGPGRRVYQLTPAGAEHLQRAAEHLRGLHDRLARFFELLGSPGS